MTSGDFTKEDRERLVRVEQQAMMLCSKIDKFVEKAESETGFPRCAIRSEKWQETEKFQERVEGFITWFYRGLVVVMGAWVVDIFLTHWHTIIKHVEGLP
jgi:hypothetical protein